MMRDGAGDLAAATSSEPPNDDVENEPYSPYATAPRAEFSGGNQVKLLRGGDELFPAMLEAFSAARREIWLATYIFDDDRAARSITDGLRAAMARGVKVRVVVDGFGSIGEIGRLREWFGGHRLTVSVFRPLDRWWAWMQPGQLRRLHHKLCAIDGEVAFVGGINVIDDRHDLRHGWTEHPRLDFAVRLAGPVVAPIFQTTRALWIRAALGRRWRDEVAALSHSAEPVARVKRLLKRMKTSTSPDPTPAEDRLPMRAAFLVRDNLRQRRAIERSYVTAIRSARERVEIACPYFYPGRVFRRVLRQAARRGVKVRLLLQGKLDYRLAGLAARVLYDELLTHGVRIFEYTPAFLHAKVALVDDDWATVGSSNIDPLSLLLNLEANVVVHDAEFTASLAAELDAAFAAATEIHTPPIGGGWPGLVRRGFVAWMANVYMRVAGSTGRY